MVGGIAGVGSQYWQAITCFMSLWEARLWLLLTVLGLHIWLAPYTKVEESFNLQATHDLLFHRIKLSEYDHQAFPGVVPRSFLGAIVLAATASPFVFISQLLGCSKLAALYIVRGCLGLLSATCFLRLQRAIEAHFGRSVGSAFLVLTAVQFHLPYYMSRTLPNTFALALINLAYADLLRGCHPARIIALLTFTSVVLRCDTLPLLGLVALYMLLTRQVTLAAGIAAGLLSGAASLALTVVVDSVLWGRWLWPEGSVLWFNTALNKSSEWGVMPPHWYWTSALPRALLGGLLLVPLGVLLERRVRPYSAIAAGYVALYSYLPHKEVRFVFGALPLFNLTAAAALARLHTNRRKSTQQFLAWLAAAGVVAGTAAATIVMVAASRLNYPGGHALARLHVLDEAIAEHWQGPKTVHIGVLAAMTGVSRFGTQGEPWHYSKEEGRSQQELLARNFTYLISAQPAIPGFQTIEAVEGLHRVRISKAPQAILRSLHNVQLPLYFETKSQLYIHRGTNR
ncbi:hypothetical protein WJX72_008886 [[Myrmecia] bisecta]|uniref:Mannosyltransferase n=1 Tax=[Myrmecia] bisecta TaxID=41462 RepID=A0AAW1PWG2_9CHLO